MAPKVGKSLYILLNLFNFLTLLSIYSLRILMKKYGLFLIFLSTNLFAQSYIDFCVYRTSLRFGLWNGYWIDVDNISGNSKEELKARAEASKIMNREILIDGICTRVSSLRCHSQALTINLKKRYLFKIIRGDSSKLFKSMDKIHT